MRGVCHPPAQHSPVRDLWLRCCVCSCVYLGSWQWGKLLVLKYPLTREQWMLCVCGQSASPTFFPLLEVICVGSPSFLESPWQCMWSAVLMTASALICGAIVQEGAKVVYKWSTLFWAQISLCVLKIPMYLFGGHCAKINAIHTWYNFFRTLQSELLTLTFICWFLS